MVLTYETHTLCGAIRSLAKALALLLLFCPPIFVYIKDGHAYLARERGHPNMHHECHFNFLCVLKEVLLL